MAFTHHSFNGLVRGRQDCLAAAACKIALPETAAIGLAQDFRRSQDISLIPTRSRPFPRHVNALAPQRSAR
jgi:hypothetical protein